MNVEKFSVFNLIKRIIYGFLGGMYPGAKSAVYSWLYDNMVIADTLEISVKRGDKLKRIYNGKWELAMSANSRGADEEDGFMIREEDILKAIIEHEKRFPVLARTGLKLMRRKPEDRDTVGKYLEENARQYPDNNAILYEDIKYTHKEFNEWINRYANYFRSIGLKRGDVVAVLLENRPEIMFAIGAMAKVGAVASLINTNQRAGTLAHSLTVVPGKFFIVGEECLEAFEEVKPEIGLTAEQRVFFLPDKGIVELPPGYTHLLDEVKDGDTSNPSFISEVMLKDPLAYIFTSGTTGLPKAAIISHYHTTSALNWWGHVVMEMKPEDVIYITLPLFHSNAINIGWASAIAGGSAVAIRRRFSASNFWNDTRKYNATAFNYIGEVCRYLMNQPPNPDDSNNPVEKIAGNGLNIDIWKDFKKRFGIDRVYEQYGATEMNFSFINIFNLDCTIGTSNMPHAIVRYDIESDEPIRDERGFLQKVSPGETGLLLVELDNPLTFKGYTDERETEKKILCDAFTKGDVWFNTGDLIRDIGYKHYQFADRRGDTFRWKGENVSTDEVANIIIPFEQIKQATVYGVIIPGTDGRAGMASLVSSIENIEEFDMEGFTKHLKQSLPSYAVPIFLRFKSEFTTTSTYKIQKNELKDEGFDPGKISDPLYVLLPGDSGYTPLTAELYGEIINGKYRF